MRDQRVTIGMTDSEHQSYESFKNRRESPKNAHTKPE